MRQVVEVVVYCGLLVEGGYFRNPSLSKNQTICSGRSLQSCSTVQGRGVRPRCFWRVSPRLEQFRRKSSTVSLTPSAHLVQVGWYSLSASCKELRQVMFLCKSRRSTCFPRVHSTSKRPYTFSVFARTKWTSGLPF